MHSPVPEYSVGGHGLSNPGFGRPTATGGVSFAPSPPVSPVASSRGGRSVRTSMSYGRDGCFAHIRMTAGAKLGRFFKRLVHFRHMDFEFACWQMLYLLVSPQKVYRNFMYRKRTKDQWARDDPAFLVLLSTTLAVSSILFAVVLGLSFGGFLQFILWVIFIDCIGTGIIIASLLWLLANQCLRSNRDVDVEWGYCWDVHLNAFFPLLVVLHMIMPICYIAYMKHAWLFSSFLGNALWFVALTYYVYITFLGYTALGFLRSTHIFLYPVTFMFIGCVAFTTLGWNLSRALMLFYHYRVS